MEMEIEEGEAREGTEEEADLLRQSTRREKQNIAAETETPNYGRKFNSYKESVMGQSGKENLEGNKDAYEEEVSDDDKIPEVSNEAWFGMGMTQKEKIEARWPWRNSLIIKLVGRTVGYHYLWRRLKAMWRTENDPLLIDLGFNFFIVKLGRREEIDRALTGGPWMIGDNYLRVQKWKPNFVAESAVINTLPVWVHFPILPVEYYTEDWLKRAGDQIGKTIKVDATTRATTRGKFARVCIEVDLTKLLKAGYVMKDKEWRVQYEGLTELCFACGKYGHKESYCHKPIK